MKKVFLILLAFTGITFATAAQENKTMYLMKRDAIIRKIALSDIDSLTFHKPEIDGVIINGTIWAARNVGAPGKFAATPEDAGMLYQWNSKTGWSISSDYSEWDSNWTGNGATNWEITNNVCPTGYRVPTRSELNALINSAKEWTTINGAGGWIFGSGEDTVFLPAAGYRELDGKLFLTGSHGYYWSSTGYEDVSIAYCGIDFQNGKINIGAYYNRAYGFSVRCIAE